MKRLSLLLLLTALTGCAHTAAEQTKPPLPVTGKAELSPASVPQLIIKGKTSKEELLARFGPPNSVTKNSRLPSAELLAKAKGELPPVARTVEFWNYWTMPTAQEVQRSAATGATTDVFRLLLFIDQDGVVADYLTETSKMSFSQEQG